jgi:hypothetical protein
MPAYAGSRRTLLYVSAAVVAVGDDLTPPSFAASEEGDVDNFTVAVRFSESIVSGTADYLTGVTIKVNTVAVTVDSATLQVDDTYVYYVVNAAEEADANDTITFEYSDTLGDIADGAGNQLGDVAAEAVTNYVGAHLRFDHEANSMQLATL